MSGNVPSYAPAEPALKVDSREELVYLLGQACEIEHGVMCEYLYAQFSLKRGPDEGLTPDQLRRVQAWEAALIGVIKQEMLHLALATNILPALGAAPHFGRPNFPILSRWYPPGVQIALVPFGEQALRHFIYLERPEGMALDDAAGFAADRHAQPLAAGAAGLVGVPQPWQTVGHLYREIETGLATLCARYGEDAIFIGPARAQAVTDIFEWPELTAVTDLASARRAVGTIVEQGEGARGDWIKSHFGIFVGILEDLLAGQAADPDFNPARPVEPAYVRLPPEVESGTLTGAHRQTPHELGDARGWTRADLLAGGSVPPTPNRRSHLRHRPPCQSPSAAPGCGLEDHQGTARCAGGGLRDARQATGPRRTRPAGHQAAVDEQRHRSPPGQRSHPQAAVKNFNQAHDSQAPAADALTSAHGALHILRTTTGAHAQES